jgi:hypothetical protein
MSGAPAAPAPAAAAAPAAPVDPVEDLARHIFIQLAANAYAAAPDTKAKLPMPYVEASFRLAEAFIEGNFTFNTAAVAAREAKRKATVDVSKIEIDFGSIGKT